MPPFIAQHMLQRLLPPDAGGRREAKSTAIKSITAHFVVLIAGNTQVWAVILRILAEGSVVILSYKDLQVLGKAMVFWLDSRVYRGSSAAEIVRKMERDSIKYRHEGGTLYDFISWLLLQLDDHIPQRELAISDKVNEETMALSFLCLLDRFGIGELDCLPDSDGIDFAEVNAS